MRPIDERIEELTQSVELLSLMHQDNEKRYTRIFEENAKMLANLVGITDRLAHIANDHEKRIDGLEGRQ